MSSPITYDAFHDRLVNAWTTLPLVFEGEKSQGLMQAGDQFVYVEIYGYSYNQDTFGAPQQNVFLETGVTAMHVMTRMGDGSRQARVYGNDLLNLFREQPMATANGTVFMHDFSLGVGEPGANFPGWFAMTATVQWYRRDITDL